MDLAYTLLNGLILSLLASLWLLFSLWINPRAFLQDYPREIQEIVPPKTQAEKRLSLFFGIPFMLLLLLFPVFSTLYLKAQGGVTFGGLWLNAAGVMFIFNIVDWLILDWLIFCTLTPRFLVIPGSEGMPAYKNYGFHFRGCFKGTGLSILGGFVVAGILFLL